MENLSEVEICRNCISREFVTNRGLICKRTGSNPNFEGQCADYAYDEAIGEVAPPPVIDVNDPAQLDEATLLREQNLGMAIICGLVAAVVGACVWALISVSTGWQIGYMAIGMGFIVGFAVRKGKGVSPIFGVVGALLALFGCLLGDYLSIIGFIATEGGVSYMEVFSTLSIGDMIPLLIENLASMTIVFYGIALFEGYKLSFRVQMKTGGKI